MANHRTADAISRRTALAGLGAGGLGLALATRRFDVAAQDATPTAASFPSTNHLIIGAWQWDYYPATNLTPAVFHADGTYVEYDSFPGVGIGRWRATGERTVELVAIFQHAVELDYLLEEPDKPLPPTLLAGNYLPGWRFIEIDATGNALTAPGYYEPRDASGAVMARQRRPA